MKKSINKIGFKFSFEETETAEHIEGIEIIDTTTPPTAFDELQGKIAGIKELMASTKFGKMLKAERLNVLELYEFYLALTVEYVNK